MNVAEAVVRLIDSNSYAQPIKPYLRYNNPANRIIAMPAYVGGQIDKAGIKWIASFPNNIRSGLPRAHSVIVLNDAETGEPVAILNSSLPSIVRTASVSGLMISRYMQKRPLGPIQLGIIGWGPIGRYHAQMAVALYGDRIERIRVFDIRGVNLSEGDPAIKDRLEISKTWEDVYLTSDIFITCTVSESRYIDRAPLPGSLLLHVSLRDYMPEALDSVQAIIVDDWDEVCREDTDVERLHLERGLAQDDIHKLTDIICRDRLSEFGTEEPILFCPMGMAVFDIAIADYYMRQAKMMGIGTEL